MMKKLLNLLTMLLLLVVSQEMMGKTIYFYNSKGWATPYVHAWNEAGATTKWPGVEAKTTVITKNGAKVYKIDVDDQYESVKFSNNGTDESGNLTLVDGAYYDCTQQTSLKAIEKSAKVLDSFYLVGKNYATGSDAFDNWDITGVSENAQYQLKKASNIYSYTITCTESAKLHFRLRQLEENATAFMAAQYGPSGTTGVLMSENTPVSLTSRNYGSSDGYLIINLQAGNTYTINFDISNFAISYEEAPEDPASYELVAKSQTSDKVFKMPMSQTRVRNSNSYNRNLWTAGFKSDLLPVDGTYDIYIKKTTEKSNAVTYLYPDPTANLGADQVPGLGLDYTNLQSVENIVYSEGSQPIYPAKLTVTKGEASSFTVALNLGGEIKKGSVENRTETFSFSAAAQSITLYKNSSISNIYAKMYPKKYKGINENYYLIGRLDGANYVPTRNTKASSYTFTDPKAATYGNTYLMERKVFYKPGTTTEEVDSVVYSKVVRKTENGFSQLFLSFAPESLLDDAGSEANHTKYWNYLETDGTETFYKNIASVSQHEAWNYIVRPEIFDEQDATAKMGSVFFRGSSTGETDPKNKTINGAQALNPLILDSEKYDYYIVRLNVTTSTYRIEFVKKDSVAIPVDGIRTYCGQVNLRLKTQELQDAVHIYAVQDFEKVSEVYNGEEGQGNLKLRALKYIPATEPVVLVVKGTDVLAKDKDGNLIKDKNGNYLLDLEVMYDTDTDFKTTRQEWWKKYGEEGYAANDDYKNYLVASLFGTTIENGEYDIIDGKYMYRARNFALNKFFNTRYYRGLSDEEKTKYTDNYYSFFRAKGTVRAGYAYLQLPSSVMDFNGQLLDHAEDDSYHFAKMNLVFDDIEGDVTGIEEVKTGSNASVREDGAYYTLQGLKVEKPTKGLYIHNGKKVIIK